MKKMIMVLVAMAVVMAAPGAMAQITNTLHDFSGASWNSGGEICEPCHTPHNGDMSVVVLWNHDVTTNSFNVYTSATLHASVGQPSAESEGCLSCHDGTVALDAFGGAAGSTNLTGTTLLGTDLSDDHPISFAYDNALFTTDGELHDPANTASGVGTGNIDDDMLFGASNDQLECASCHDPHGSAGHSSLLVKSNAGSALCLTCHDK